MKKRPAGFTLIELLVVVGIIGILSIGALASYSATVRNSRDAKRKTDLEQIRVALELYKSDNGGYPNTSGSTEGGLKTALTTPVAYMNTATFPKDPTSTSNYYYQRITATTYRLCSFLENSTAGPACPGATQTCGTSNCNYGITQL